MRFAIVAVAVGAVAVAGTAAFALQRDVPRRSADLMRVASVDASVDATPFAEGEPCTGRFETIALDHVTTVEGETIGQFDTNGAGVAVADLDGDALPEIVLANLDGPSSILWNDGGMRFTRQELDDRSARGVAAVDLDADGRLDLVLTHRGAGVSAWHNDGGSRPQRFSRTTLPGVLHPAYSMHWADLGGDGALDLVTGSYDADLDRARGSAFLFGDGAGIFVYVRDGDGYRAERLARTSQTLTIASPDLDGDGTADLLTGNDFTVPDRAWLRTAGGWQETSPFGRTTENTMSTVLADIDNDGRDELYVTDMKPARTDPGTLARWLPVMADMRQEYPAGDPQRPRNVLQVRMPGGGYRDEAQERGIDATGWSWSTKLGDLDRDGWLDIYAANGMIDGELFAYLPGAELVEPNEALRNDGTGSFVRVPEWGLGSLASGRGMTLADLDLDGRLDAVVNNLRSPSEVHRNLLCGGSALEVDLRRPGDPNPFAIGARLTLWTSGPVMDRVITADSGYLSGDLARAHFGIPDGVTVERLEIVWPDGATSVIPSPAPGTLFTVSRS